MSPDCFQKLKTQNPVPKALCPQKPCGGGVQVCDARSDLTDVNNPVGTIPYCGDDQMESERDMFYAAWDDYMSRYGVRIEYIRNGYSLEDHDFVYGEDSTSSFLPPKLITGAMEFAKDGSDLGRFGFEGMEGGRLIITIDEWDKLFTAQIVPTVGDLIRVVDQQCNRPGGFGKQVYEITAKTDYLPASTFNVHGGHYVWILDFHRFNDSYEAGVPAERLDDPVNDDAFHGPTDKGRPPKEAPKPYEQEIDEAVKPNYDQHEKGRDQDSVYGGYHDDDVYGNF